ncbi:MAG TPA: bilirubin oxidase, partial [Candidatus Binatia bacterium]|nr:bilirubin oxidase [Candidatus Binatia bacterium]
MITRRAFLKYTGGTALTLFAFNKFGLPKAIAQIPGGTLDPDAVSKFVTPLLIPPVMPTAGRIVLQGGKNADYYEISMKQISQQILPAGLPATTVWGYGAVAADSKRGLLLHNAPSLTIEAKWNTPVRVKWINDLKDADGNFL